MRVTKSRFRLFCATAAIALCLSCAAKADSLQSARVLLRVSNTAQQFDRQTQHHVTQVLRTYSSIVAMETGLELPNLIRNAIANCYAREYAWQKFERGFAVILSQHLSAVQIDLLIGFYRNQGIPPNGIQHFKDAIASASAIAANSAELIYTTSPGCVQQDAQLISRYLSEAGLSVDHHNRFD